MSSIKHLSTVFISKAVRFVWQQNPFQPRLEWAIKDDNNECRFLEKTLKEACTCHFVCKGNTFFMFGLQVSKFYCSTYMSCVSVNSNSAISHPTLSLLGPTPSNLANAPLLPHSHSPSSLDTPQVALAFTNQDGSSMEAYESQTSHGK